VTASWRYLFADLLTNQILGELPLAGVSFGSTLNDIGSFAATLQLGDPRVAKALGNFGGQAGGPLQEGRTAIYVELNGVLVWGGILWTVSYDSPSRVVTLGGNEFFSYFSQRVISFSNGVANTLSFITTDVLAVIESIVTSAQALGSGNIGVNVPAITSGVLVTVSWDTTQSTPIFQAIQQLSQQSGGAGFDFGIDVAYNSSGVPTKNLTLSYPRRGRIAGSTGLVFDAGAAKSLGYTWPRDATQMADVVYGVGAGTGSTSLRATAGFQQALAAGYPLLEAPYSRTDVVSQTILNGLTVAQAAAVSVPVALPTVTMSLAAPDPVFGSYIIGDDARVVIPADEWFPAGYDGYQRITAWTVTPPEGGDVGNIAVTFGTPPVEEFGGGVIPKKASMAQVIKPIQQRLLNLETTPAVQTSTIRGGSLVVQTSGGQEVLSVGDNQDGTTGLEIFDASGNERVLVGQYVWPLAPHIGVVVYGQTVFNAAGNPVLQIGLQPDGTYGLAVYDAAGNKRAQMGVLDNGDYGLGVNPVGGGTQQEVSPSIGESTNSTITVGTTPTSIVGLSATVGASGNALVTIGGYVQNLASNQSGFMYLYVDGVAAPGVQTSVFNSGTPIGSGASRTLLLTGLSPGSHVFSMYAASSTTSDSTVTNASIVVQPL
jgi:hypothetical protein